MASQKTSTQGFVNAFNRAIAALKNGEKVESSASVSDTHLY